MPAIVGAVTIQSIDAGTAGAQFGDIFKLSPKVSAKTHAGSGSFNTGNFMDITTKRSNTNTLDMDVNDQGNFLNA
ncbi:spore germination protein [Priestia koreensis]|uniref:Spore germination protein n=1 Tax=Priestia koreensis TaxID=284581 RepID=A0A0M0L5G1_9BACI|nr:spore germination protein [Priestia koreensis]KOO46311.1 hypothetical protein AMD01_10710 [Priestia koreensis]